MYTWGIPKSFNEKFGKKMPTTLKILCGDDVWKSKYNYELSRLDGLRPFLLYYRVTIFSSVMFDYYGDDLLTVKIFRENVAESFIPKYDNQKIIN